MSVSSGDQHEEERIRMVEKFDREAAYFHIPTIIIVVVLLAGCFFWSLRKIRLEQEQAARSALNATTSQQDQPTETEKQ